MICGAAVIFFIIDTDSGLMPELAVTAIVPSLLRARPKGCGAIIILRPEGVRKRPLGRTVVPSLLTEVYSRPAGADKIYGSWLSLPQRGRTTNKQIKRKVTALNLIKPVSILPCIHNASA